MKWELVGKSQERLVKDASGNFTGRSYCLASFTNGDEKEGYHGLRVRNEYISSVVIPYDDLLIGEQYVIGTENRQGKIFVTDCEKV